MEVEKQILFVDDDPYLLSAYERQFRKSFVVSIASGGQEALDLLQHHEFSVIVSDMRMPGMSGLEFLAKAREVAPHSLQILLTGNLHIDEEVKRLDIHRCFEKPCSLKVLGDAITEATQEYARLMANC